MTYNATLIDLIQQWTQRLQNSSNYSINGEWTIYWKRLNEIPIVKTIINDALDKANLPDDFQINLLNSLKQGLSLYDYKFKDETHRFAVLYSILNECLVQLYTELNNALIYLCNGNTFGEQRNDFLQTYLHPVLHYIIDYLDNENALLYLLDRYKRRTEWFFKESLISKYKQAENNFEQIFDDDLRLFLFDQGIDYPFSTPNSASGRADIVGLLHTNTPLVLEIKIWDSSKGYKKNKIQAGFNQIVQYTNDYNKSVGYLVVFNVDSIEIEIESEDSRQNFPNRILYNNRVYYILIININSEFTASTKGKLLSESISKNELIN